MSWPFLHQSQSKSPASVPSNLASSRKPQRRNVASLQICSRIQGILQPKTKQTRTDIKVIWGFCCQSYTGDRLGRPRTTWLKTIDDDVKPQNFGVHTAWRKARVWEVSQQVRQRSVRSMLPRRRRSARLPNDATASALEGTQ